MSEQELLARIDILADRAFAWLLCGIALVLAAVVVLLL